jgi:hypothetical protein
VIEDLLTPEVVNPELPVILRMPDMPEMPEISEMLRCKYFDL